MNKLEAIIKPEKLTSVRDALNEAGCKGMSIIRIEGLGDNPGVSRRGGRGTTSYVEHTLPKIKLEIVVRDEDTDRVIGITKDSANTNTPGDGRIFVSPVAAAIRIDTDERDSESLR